MIDPGQSSSSDAPKDVADGSIMDQTGGEEGMMANVSRVHPRLRCVRGEVGRWECRKRPDLDGVIGTSRGEKR